MTLPTPLPPAGVQVLVRDNNGFDGLGWVITPSSSLVPGKTEIAVATVSALLADYYDFDDSATPANQTWRYDSRFPVDAFPSDVSARVDDLELAQAIGNTSFGVVAYHATSAGISLNLGSNTYQTIVGGALSGDSEGVSLDAGTGILTVDNAGVFMVDFSATSRRVGLTSVDATIAVFADGAESVIRTRETLASVGTARTLTGRAPIRLAAGDTLSLRAKTSAAVEIEIMDTLLSLFWLSA